MLIKSNKDTIKFNSLFIALCILVIISKYRFQNHTNKSINKTSDISGNTFVFTLQAPDSLKTLGKNPTQRNSEKRFCLL